MRSGYKSSVLGVEPVCRERLRSGRGRAGASCLSDWRDGRGRSVSVSRGCIATMVWLRGCVRTTGHGLGGRVIWVGCRA